MVEQVRSFRLLPKLLDHEDGELTATQKVKRKAVEDLFAGLVESMYAGGAR
jgi:long-chain acyl-CoA synthetase